jgi:hypothetical protein
MSLYQIKTVEVNFEDIDTIQLYLECQSSPPEVDGLSIDIGHGCDMTSGVCPWTTASR